MFVYARSHKNKHIEKNGSLHQLLILSNQFFFITTYVKCLNFYLLCAGAKIMGKKKRKRATKKRKQSKAQLDNLTKGWDRIPKPPPSPKFKTCGVGPTAKTYGRHNPSAATITKIDILHDKAVEAIARIDTARSLTESRSVKERIMFLQFTLKFLEKHKCLMSVAVENAVNFFCWRRQDAYELLKAYLDDPDQKNVPPAKRLKPRGRASLLFKERYADRFMVLKNNHMTEILQYVRLANAERGGMVTMGRIQAHMLTKFGILFKKWNIYYCLTKRLKLKFSVSARPKLQFSPARIRATRIFCKKSDEAIKLERAGTHIIVYIDESYCYMNHRQSHTWNEDGVPVNRTGGKGTLFIIVHALTKDGPLLPEGERFAVDEWSAGVQPTTEMIFRAKFATKHHVRDYHDTMDSEFFMYWVQNRLVPAFEQRYPAKKMILMHVGQRTIPPRTRVKRVPAGRHDKRRHCRPASDTSPQAWSSQTHQDQSEAIRKHASTTTPSFYHSARHMVPVRILGQHRGTMVD